MKAAQNPSVLMSTPEASSVRDYVVVLLIL